MFPLQSLASGSCLGILAFVLAPLDATFSEAEFSSISVLGSMAIGATMIGLGIVMETRS
jgi:hypothetical protein